MILFYLFYFGFYIFCILFNLHCIFSPLPFSSLIPPSPQQSPHSVHVRESFSFLLSPYTPYPHPQLSYCSPSMNLSPFFLLFLFVHYIPHISEIMWYLSFSDWLISLSIMFSRSIHTVAKGTIFFFFMAE